MVKSVKKKPKNLLKYTSYMRRVIHELYKMKINSFKFMSSASFSFFCRTWRQLLYNSFDTTVTINRVSRTITMAIAKIDPLFYSKIYDIFSINFTFLSHYWFYNQHLAPCFLVLLFSLTKKWWNRLAVQMFF